jgi:hypothetical protein
LQRELAIRFLFAIQAVVDFVVLISATCSEKSCKAGQYDTVVRPSRELDVAAG